MAIGTVLIRADASVAIGTGHVMRCLALAQCLQELGADVIFVQAQSTAALDGRLLSEGLSSLKLDVTPGGPEDAARTVALAESRKATWVVVDGYQFDSSYQLEIKRANLNLVLLDDNGEGKAYFADLVVNQNIHADVEMYRVRERHVRLMLGTRYAMVRREFGTWTTWKRGMQDGPCKLLVTMGGSDPGGLTLRVLEIVNPIAESFTEVLIVVGGSNPCLPAVEAAAGRIAGKAHVVTDVSNMPELMAWADMAISAAGSTCWEMCLMGLPAIILDAAPNQSCLGRELDRRGAAIYFDPQEGTFDERLTTRLKLLASSRERRQRLGAVGKHLVDGRGAERVAVAMQQHSITVRRVQPEDCEILWHWANDPKVREVSFQSASIPWAEHVRWFEKKFHDPECQFFIGMEAKTPIGQVRFDRLGESEFEISISVAPERRGKGLGGWLIPKAIAALVLKSRRVKIHAFVKSQNETSLQLFSEAGFRKLEGTDPEKHGTVHFIYETLTAS